jgi:hypothetical protein
MSRRSLDEPDAVPVDILVAVIDAKGLFMDFTGAHHVVSSSDFDDEYLRLGRSPYLTLRQEGEFVKGEYEIGVMCETINGGAHSDFIDFGATMRWKRPSAKARPHWKGNS